MKAEVLRQIPEAENFLRQCERLTFKQRQTIVKQGDPSDSIYLILEGSVAVIIDGDDDDAHQEMVVSYLNPGDFFGEMGLFGEEFRTANLVARAPVEVARISYDRFHQVRGN
ncbi:MAG: cyclic nucleotide-binding domain-containing protein, partial [Halieaceae bacterium]|nr:cyclic nucleotide-binding domain-containing protein [Halieaceae bacterium]